MSTSNKILLIQHEKYLEITYVKNQRKKIAWVIQRKHQTVYWGELNNQRNCSLRFISTMSMSLENSFVEITCSSGNAIIRFKNEETDSKMHTFLTIAWKISNAKNAKSSQVIHTVSYKGYTDNRNVSNVARKHLYAPRGTNQKGGGGAVTQAWHFYKQLIYKAP